MKEKTMLIVLISKGVKLKLFKYLFILIAFYFFTVLTHAMRDLPMENSLQQDILNIKLKDSTKLDISKIIQKHIPIGTTEENALKILEDSGFKIYKQDEKALINPLPLNPSDELFIAVFKYKKMIFSHYEVSVMIYFKKEIVSNVSSVIIYKSL